MPLSLIRGIALSLLALLSVGARAESITYLGQTVRFEIPAGFCSVTKAGGAVMVGFEEQRRLMASHVILMEMLAPCAEIARANAGNEVYFSTWLQLQVLAPNGQARKIDVPRKQFVSTIGKSAEKLDPSAINKKIDDRLKEMKSDMSFDRSKMQVIGADDDALYVSNRAQVRREGMVPVDIFGITGMTVANKLPINVTSYQSLDKVPDLGVAPKNMRLLLASVLKN